MSKEIKELSEAILFQKKSILENVIADNGPEGLNIYLNNYRGALLNSLKQKYPTVIKALGENNFLYFAYKYIKTHFSLNADLNIYGQSFYNYLSSFSELDNLEEILTIAQIDWVVFQERTSVVDCDVNGFNLWCKLNNIDKSIHARKKLEFSFGDNININEI